MCPLSPHPQDDVEGGSKNTATSSGRSEGDGTGIRMPYFVGICVLLAIVYVLSRTGSPVGCPEGVGAMSSAFDIDSFREVAPLSRPQPPAALGNACLDG